ncbi:IclR family transcriptional regulator [soil metagenome]
MLEAVSASRDGISAVELTQVLKLPRTTVDRLLNALMSSELVMSEAARVAKFRLGSRLLRIIQADDEWLKLVSKRVLKELASDTHQTSFIAKLEGLQIRSLAMESPDASVGVYVTPGHMLPPHASATGKLLTAMQDQPLRDEILARELSAYTDKTIVKIPALMKEYAEISRLGYSLDQGEHVEGLSTIACPVLLPDRSLGSYAVAVTGMSDHFKPDAVKRLLPMLQSAASQFAAAVLLPQRRI